MTLYAEIYGDIAARPPLVLLHGFGSSASAWGPIRAMLAEEQPVIAYDLPGHRKSLTADGREGAKMMPGIILADLKARGVTKFHIAGHSMGGVVATLVALKAGEAARSLTLLAPGGVGAEINHRVLCRYAGAASEMEIRAALEPMAGFNFDMPDAVIAEMATERTAPGALAALDVIYRSIFVDPDADVKKAGTIPREMLAALAPPVTVMWGTQDMVLPFHQMENVPKTFNKIRVEETGHMLLMECPAKVADALTATIERAR